MKKISAKIVADSIDSRGNRITSFILTYPRFIHSELMTHRMFSRGSASSRAIPFEKMLKMVNDDPFIPIAWQRDHKGMQGNEYFEGGIVEHHKSLWLKARNNIIEIASKMANDTLYPDRNLTKQLCNRLLEPFMWHTVLVTATEYENFFDLRCPKYHIPVSGEEFTFRSKKDCIANHSNPDNIKKLENYSLIDWLKISQSQAEIHIQTLAEEMWDACNESTPRQLSAGQWHIPFGDQMDEELIEKYININAPNGYSTWIEGDKELIKLKVSIARCARLSYMTFDGEIDYEKDIKLHDQLLLNKHMSPFEHVARCMSDNEYASFRKGFMELEWLKKDSKGQLYASFEYDYCDGISDGWCNNFRGFIPYRYLIENEKFN